MASARKNSGLLATAGLTALLAIPLLLAPPVIRGLAALEWVTRYASMNEWPRPRRAAARALVEKTDLALSNLAPLPQASDAAMRALEVGQRLEERERDREAALLIYDGVRASCVRIRDRPFSGPGFAVIEARAAALADAARKTEAK